MKLNSKQENAIYNPLSIKYALYMLDGILGNEDEAIVLNFDKSFIYFIRDKKIREIWFAGTVYGAII